MKFVAGNQSAEPLQPSKQALHDPAAFVAAQSSAVLRLAAVLALGRDHFDAVFLVKMPIQRVGIIRLVAGNSRHCAPVRRIHSTPFSTARVSAGGRPRPSARRGNRNNGSTTAHSASVTSPRARIRGFAELPAPPPLCRQRLEITSEIRPQVFIGQVLAKADRWVTGSWRLLPRSRDRGRASRRATSCRQPRPGAWLRLHGRPEIPCGRRPDRRGSAWRIPRSGFR